MMHIGRVREIINEVKQQYNSIAAEWHVSRACPSSLKIKQIKFFKKGDKVLDIGCGNGLLAGQITARGVKYFGLDISSALIKIARQQYQREIQAGVASFTVGDISRKWPYAANYFSAAISFAVLHHIPSDMMRVHFFQELFRVLQTGGYANIIVWNLFNEWPQKRFKIELQRRHPHPDLGENDFLVGWSATPGKKIHRYIHGFSAAELKFLAGQAGFKKITIGYYTRQGRKMKNGEELVLNLVK